MAQQSATAIQTRHRTRRKQLCTNRSRGGGGCCIRTGPSLVILSPHGAISAINLAFGWWSCFYNVLLRLPPPCAGHSSEGPRTESSLLFVTHPVFPLSEEAHPKPLFVYARSPGPSLQQLLLAVVLRHEVEDNRVRQLRRLVHRAVPGSWQLDEVLRGGKHHAASSTTLVSETCSCTGTGGGQGSTFVEAVR